MHNTLIAITASALIAATFAFLTEPVIGAQSGLPKYAADATSKPAAKRDRLDLNPARSRLLSSESVGGSNNCALRPAQPALHSPHGPTVVASLWQIELALQSAIANAKTIG